MARLIPSSFLRQLAIPRPQFTMPIKVACRCGQSFAVKDELAGKTLKCPKCQQPLPIPAQQSAPSARPAAPAPAATSLASLFDDAGMKEHHGPRCPQCGQPLKSADAVLCTHCGFHVQTGAKVSGARVAKAGERGHTEAADSLLERAAKQIEIDKIEAKKNVSSGMPAWVIFLALAGLVAFVATMFLIPRDKAFLYTGYGIAGFGSLMATYFNIRMIMVAFQESNVCGFMYLFVPIYPLYYLITRWERMGGFFLMNLAYSFVVGFGIGMMVLSPFLKKDPNKQEGWRPSNPTVEVVAADWLPEGSQS